MRAVKMRKGNRPVNASIEDSFLARLARITL